MTGPKTSKCPTCGGAAARRTAAGPNKAFPFCTARCQMIDLGRWLDEDYRIPEGAGDQSGGGAEGAPAAGEDRNAS
jgi:endogenous inhibitor of DNA gyrase (YacG/DUF329 family)